MWGRVRFGHWDFCAFWYVEMDCGTLGTSAVFLFDMLGYDVMRRFAARLICALDGIWCYALRFFTHVWYFLDLRICQCEWDVPVFLFIEYVLILSCF